MRGRIQDGEGVPIVLGLAQRGVEAGRGLHGNIDVLVSWPAPISPTCRRCLRVQVEQQGPLALDGRLGREVNRQRGLAASALLTDERESVHANTLTRKRRNMQAWWRS